MITREVMETAVAGGLQVSSTQELSEIVLDIEQHNQSDPTTDVDAAHEVVGRQRQLVFACLEELIAQRAVKSILQRLDEGGSLMGTPSPANKHETSSIGRATQATYDWLKSSVDEVW